MNERTSECCEVILNNGTRFTKNVLNVKLRILRLLCLCRVWGTCLSLGLGAVHGVPRDSGLGRLLVSAWPLGRSEVGDGAALMGVAGS